jgi:glycosyltransferase involved in cell wall biosynthesis
MARPPHIVVHDYSGHPGQAQLSRSLARRGYEVTHQHCPSYATGKGSLEHEPGDPGTLRFEACPMESAFKRYSCVTRIRQEVAYGRKAGRVISAKAPQAVVFSNVPLIAHAVMARHLTKHKIPMVFWLQDIYSEAIGATARKRLGALGRPIAWLAGRIERRIARQSAAIVAISPTFLTRLREWKVADKAIVVPNWAPIDELPVKPRRNAWSERMGLSDTPVVLYSGTLGLKHDPSLLALMADELRITRPDARVVVISEGKGRDWLEEWKRDTQADNLVLLDFQPYDELPDVLGSADVLVALLEPDASRFSVPSKVLTYLCARRAILGVMPPTNSVAEILLANQAGTVVDPSERVDIAWSVTELLNDEELRLVMGKAGRRYAENEFSADRAADRFEVVMAARLAVPMPVPQEATVVPLRPSHASPMGHDTTTHRRNVRSTLIAVGSAAAAVLIAIGLGSHSGSHRTPEVASAATSQLRDPAASPSSGPAAGVVQGGTLSGGSSQPGATLAGSFSGSAAPFVASASPASAAGSSAVTASSTDSSGATSSTTASSNTDQGGTVPTTVPTTPSAPVPAPPAMPTGGVGSVVGLADQIGSAVGTAVPPATTITGLVGPLVDSPL